MSEEELSELQERLADAQAEVERRQAMAADSAARATHQERVAGRPPPRMRLL